MRNLSVSVAVAILVACPVDSINAQARFHRRGLWGEICSGPASIRIASSTPATVTTKSGTGACVRIGGTLSPNVLFGAESFGFLDETFGFAKQDTSLIAENGGLMALVMWYPGRSGFFMKGGFGVADGVFTMRPAPDSTLEVNGTGVGLTFGIGYDVPISRKLAVTFNVEAIITAIGDIVLPTGRVDDVIASMYHVGLGMAIR